MKHYPSPKHRKDRAAWRQKVSAAQNTERPFRFDPKVRFFKFSLVYVFCKYL